MKYAYEFTTETVEMEVSEEWIKILKDLDRMEYNNTHTETRRHCGFRPDMRDSQWLACSDFDPGFLLELREDVKAKELHAAEISSSLDSLSESQKHLIYHIFVKKMKIKDYAKMCGVDSSAISHRIKTIKKLLLII